MPCGPFEGSHPENAPQEDHSNRTVACIWFPLHSRENPFLCILGLLSIASGSQVPLAS